MNGEWEEVSSKRRPRKAEETQQVGNGRRKDAQERKTKDGMVRSVQQTKQQRDQRVVSAKKSVVREGSYPYVTLPKKGNDNNMWKAPPNVKGNRNQGQEMNRSQGQDSQVSIQKRAPQSHSAEGVKMQQTRPNMNQSKSLVGTAEGSRMKRKPMPTMAIDLSGFITNALKNQTSKKKKSQGNGTSKDGPLNVQGSKSTAIEKKKRQEKAQPKRKSAVEANPNPLDSRVRELVLYSKSKPPGKKKKHRTTTLKKSLYRDRAARWYLFKPDMKPVPLQLHPVFLDYAWQVSAKDEHVYADQDHSNDIDPASNNDGGEIVDMELIYNDGHEEETHSNHEVDGDSDPYEGVESDQDDESEQNKETVPSEDLEFNEGIDQEIVVGQDEEIGQDEEMEVAQDEEIFSQEGDVGSERDEYDGDKNHHDDEGVDQENDARESEDKEIADGNDAADILTTYTDQYLEPRNWDATRITPVFFGCRAIPKELIVSAAEEKIEEKGKKKKKRKDPIRYRVPNTMPVRTYVNQALSSELDEKVRAMLNRLMELQERLRLKDPVKAQMRRRLVFGFREVIRGIRSRRCKCIVVSPNIEQGAGMERGIDDKVKEMIDLCAPTEDEILQGLEGVPIIFALSKSRMGSALNKQVKVSAVGVYSADGAYEEYKSTLSMVKELQSVFSIILTGESFGNRPPICDDCCEFLEQVRYDCIECGKVRCSRCSASAVAKEVKCEKKNPLLQFKSAVRVESNAACTVVRVARILKPVQSNEFKKLAEQRKSEAQHKAEGIIQQAQNMKKNKKKQNRTSKPIVEARNEVNNAQPKKLSASAPEFVPQFLAKEK